MKIYEFPSETSNESKYTYIGETDQEIQLGAFVKLNNRYYRCCMLDLSNDSSYVQFVNDYIPRDDDTYTNNYLTCPYCGYEDENSFELPDEDDEYECPQCKSILKYNRQITVSYDVQVVKEKEPIEVEFK